MSSVQALRGVEAREPVGLIGVLATVLMLFAALTAALLVRRTAPDWVPVVLPRLLWLSSMVLIASSVTVEAARRSRARAWIHATLALGILFLILQVLAWRQLAAGGVFLATNPHGAFVYVLSAIHGLHLVGGLLALVWVAVRRRHHGPCAIYWHVLGAVWLYVFLILSVL